MSANCPENGLNKDDTSSRDKWLVPFFSIAIGLVGFLTVVGPRALYPSNIAWLGQGDPATHYLGWLFFRNSEWSCPIGLNPTYGLELSNAIIFSDSNPLFAIFFKVLSIFLPETFQYFGIWLLACFLLQAFFAYKLIGLITKSAVIRVLGSCFYVFAPPMLWRLHGHLSLAGHFLIVASLYQALAPSPRPRIAAWIAFLVVSALTHAYLLAMVGLLWVADLTGRLIIKRISFQRVLLEFVIALAAVLLVCWQVGYFSVDQGVISSGFGFFRMHLLSVFDPKSTIHQNGWSYILRDIPDAPGVYEGFNYLGIGMIFLGICALPRAFSSQAGFIRSILKKPVLFAVLTSLLLFAISNKIGVQSIWFELQLPDFFDRIANVFRASGRMFWPVFYMLYFVTIFIIIRAYDRRVAITLLSLGLLVQVVDTSRGWLAIRSKTMVTPSSVWPSKMTSPFWREAATKYRKVRWLLPKNEPAEWKEIANYAGAYRLATDAVYLARVGTGSLISAQQKAITVLTSGQFEPDALYLLDSGLIPLTAMNLDVQSDLFAQIDDFFVVAPGWKFFSPYSTVSGEIDTSAYLPNPVSIDQRLVFAKNKSGLAYLGAGWSHPENGGTWSDGAAANLVVPIETLQVATILVEAKPLLSASHFRQVVHIRINGFDINPVILTAASRDRFQVHIPPEVKGQLKHSPVLKIQFHFPQAVRPVDIGVNVDQRKLALKLIALTVQ